MKHMNNVVSGGATNTPDRINLDWRFIMDTLPPYAADNKSLILFPPVDKTYRFYVYTLAYPDGKVFYVGKGTGDRINMHEREAADRRNVRNPYKVNIIRKIWRDGVPIVKTKLAFFRTHEEAIECEIALIFLLPDLANLSGGGEGQSGYVWTEEQKQKIRGRKLSEERKQKMLEGRKRLMPPKVVKVPISRKGKKLSSEARAKISASHKGQKRTYVESEETKRKRNETRRQGGWLHNPEETRKTWREQRLGKASFTHTPESLEKKRIASTGRHITEETKQKVREAKTGLDMHVVEGVKEIRLSYWRLQRDLTQRELARLCHVASDTISEVENGKKIPRMGVLQKLAMGLNIAFDQLVICEEIRVNEGPIQQLRGLWNDI